MSRTECAGNSSLHSDVSRRHCPGGFTGLCRADGLRRFTSLHQLDWLRTGRAALVAAASLLISGGVWAWQVETPFRATVHGHVFDKVVLSDSSCTFNARLYFDAPPKAYAERSKVRNHYRFRARLRLANGQTIVSGLFFSPGPTRRAYTVRVDTANEGCWAKYEQRLVDIDVEGCRGERCHVEPFRK